VTYGASQVSIQHWILLFLIFVRLRLSSMSATHRWSVINLKCCRAKKWLHLLTALITAVDSSRFFYYCRLI